MAPTKALSSDTIPRDTNERITVGMGEYYAIKDAEREDVES